MLAAAAALALLSFGAGACKREPFRWTDEARARAAKALPALAEPISDLSAPALALELSLPAGALIAPITHVPATTGGVLATLHVPPHRGERDFRSPVRLQSHGNFSKLICKYPKLSMALPDAARAVRRSWFMQSHCNDRSKRYLSADYLQSLRLAFALHVLFDLPTLRIKSARVDYIDSRRQLGARRDKPALLVEHARDLALRAAGGLSHFVLSGKGSVATMDADAVARLHLFQILVNNNDWKLYELQPLARYLRSDVHKHYLHNVLVLVPPAGKPRLPSGFDFDISSFVGMPRGLAELSGAGNRTLVKSFVAPAFTARHGALAAWLTLRVVHFLARHRRAVAARALDFVRTRRPAFAALLLHAELGTPAITRARKHVDAFYRAIELATGGLQRVRTRAGAALFVEANGTRRACDKLVAGTPLELVAVGHSTSSSSPAAQKSSAASSPAKRVAVRLVQRSRVIADEGLDALCKRDGLAVETLPRQAFIERAAIAPLWRP